MAERPLTETAPRGWRALPAALRIGILFLAARAVTTAFLLAAAELSGVGSRFGEGANLATLTLGWDAQWYWYLAENGYPTDLPLTDSEDVAENQWAFMPIFAYLAKGLGVLLGSWGAGAVVISLVAGYLACLVLYRIVRMRASDDVAIWAVVLFASAPLAAMFQVGYAESLFLLWLFLSLWLVMRRQYGWLYLLIPLMAFTRPGVLAFGLFLGAYGLWRWFSRHREPLAPAEVVHIVVLGLLSVVTGFSWQLLAGAVTGESGAYLATELAWRRNWLGAGGAGFFPFDGFLQGAAFWFGSWGLGAVTGYIVLAASVVGVAALLLFEPHVKRMGVETRLWSASYLVYLLAVFFPQSSIFRLLLPLSPLWGAVAMPRATWWRVGMLGACLLGQWWWIYNMYALGNTYWQIP
ncbi:hypothetical protein [Microbacterium sp.]|uniref:hypothetical protein n=1 Tax=Microbacterium sp. TaxID=51671 RepID=UPI0025E377FA|nr:hypothetical protein [Microbacterium sp.]